MNNLNTVLIEGKLTRDPELGNGPAQTPQCRLSVANNRYFLNRDGKWIQDSSFFTVFVYGNVATACLTRLKKGRGVRIVGRLKQFTRIEAGLRSEKICILAEHIEFQPEKRNEPFKEPEREPGEINTRADLSQLDDVPADNDPAEIVPDEGDYQTSVPNEEPETGISKEDETEVPDCTVESEEENSEDGFGQAAGF